MEHPERQRLRETAERLLEHVSRGDRESFELIWNGLTFRDQRTIVAALMAELVDLRRGAPSGRRRRRAA